MNREILVHVKIHIMISKSNEFKEKLENAYVEFKKRKIKDKDFYNCTTDLSKNFSFYELTYFDKMKNPKYREIIEMESNSMLLGIEKVTSMKGR